MAQLDYLDFDLQIERVGDGYRARVLKSPVGESAEALFEYPLSPTDLKVLRLTLRGTAPSRSALKAESEELKELREVGTRLFNAVFSGEVGNLLFSSLENVERSENQGLRIRLVLRDTALMGLPWEYLYSPLKKRFIARSIFSPVVRYMQMPSTARPLAVTPPVRVLAMISKPIDFEELDVAKELENLNRALGDVIGRRLVELHTVTPPTLDALRRQLRLNQYHIFHFVGHGDFDARASMGGLVLENELGRGVLESAQEIGEVLHDHRSLRLAILNACKGASALGEDPFAGVAQNLLLQGIPAVIAMQFAITDDAAITFSKEFYTALTDGFPVDAALAEARKAIYTRNNELEWGTPVLYMRSPDGKIFDLVPQTDADRSRAELAGLLQQAQTAAAREDWATALERVRAVLARDVNHTEAIVLEHNLIKQQQWAQLYADGIAHFQAGRWRVAYETFKRLRELKPDYKDVDARLANVQREMARSEEQNQKRAEIDTLLRSANGALEKRDWMAALQMAQAILALDATNREAAALSSRAQQGQQLDALYATAQQHFNGKRWTEIIEYNQRIRTMGGKYPELDKWLTTAQRELARQAASSQASNAPPRGRTLESTSTTETIAPAVPKKGSGFFGSVRLLIIGGVLGIGLLSLCVCIAILQSSSNNRAPVVFPSSNQPTTCYLSASYQCPLLVPLPAGAQCTCYDQFGTPLFNGKAR